MRILRDREANHAAQYATLLRPTGDTLLHFGRMRRWNFYRKRSNKQGRINKQFDAIVIVGRNSAAYCADEVQIAAFRVDFYVRYINV